MDYRAYARPSDGFWAGEHATAYVLADEDMFLLKVVSSGDLGAGRRRDIDFLPLETLLSI